MKIHFSLTAKLPLLLLSLLLWFSCSDSSSESQGSTDSTATVSETEEDLSASEMGGEGDAFNELIGTWAADDGTYLVFTAEGMQRIDASGTQSGEWHVYDGLLFMLGDEGNSYELMGESLKLQGKTYSRSNEPISIDQPHLIRIKGDKVNVRAEADPNSKVMFQVNEGEQFEPLAQSSFVETVGKRTDFWHQIQKDGKKGWVFGSFTNQNMIDNSRKDTLTFMGAGLGDYFHMMFAWADSANAEGHGWKSQRYYGYADGTWDFGYGSSGNSYSGYALDEEGEGNPEYIGKTFIVEWKVALLDVFEGDGSMETIKIEVPVIAGLELLE